MVTENFHSNRILSGIFSRLIGRALLGQWALQRAGWLAPFASVPQLRVLRWMPGQNSAERRKFGTQSRRGKGRKDRQRWEWNVDRDWNQRERRGEEESGEEEQENGGRGRDKMEIKKKTDCVREEKVEKWKNGRRVCVLVEVYWPASISDLATPLIACGCLLLQCTVAVHEYSQQSTPILITPTAWNKQATPGDLFAGSLSRGLSHVVIKWWLKLAVATCSNVYFDCFRMRLICNAWIVDT